MRTRFASGQYTRLKARLAARGFTMIELAVVLIIMGLIASVMVPSLFNLIERDKVSVARSNLDAYKARIMGYAVRTQTLPTAATVPEIDVWGSSYGYLPFATGTDICSLTTTPLSVTKGTQTISNVAFVVTSNGKDAAADITLISPVNVSSPDDDLYRYVTLFELYKMVCPTAGDQGGPQAPEGAILAMSFDEGSGNTATGTGTVGGTAEFHGTPEWSDEGYGGSIILNHDDGDYLSIPYSSDYDLIDFTITGWFKTSDDGYFGVITAKETDWRDRNWWVSIWNSNDNQDSWNCTAYAGGELAHRTSTVGYVPVACDDYRHGVNIASPNATADGNWHFFANQVNQTVARIYIDGQLFSQQENPGVPETQQADIFIGRGVTGGSSRNFNGYIDEITFYDRALNATEIKDFYDDFKKYYP